MGADQRKPEYHAITVHAGSSASAPEGFTTLRSRIRAHNKVSERIGNVMSHSRSQSGLASSPEAIVSSNEELHNTSSRNATPTVNAALNSTVTQKVSAASSA